MKLDIALKDRQSIFLDIAPIIYFIERHPKYFQLVKYFFGALDAGDFVAVTSPITLAECLVVPLRDGNLAVQQTYESLIAAGPHTNFVQTNAVISRQSAQFRVVYSLKLPDAMQLATAIESGCDAFLSNDIRLKRISEIDVLILDELEI